MENEKNLDISALIESLNILISIANTGNNPSYSNGLAKALVP